MDQHKADKFNQWRKALYLENPIGKNEAEQLLKELFLDNIVDPEKLMEQVLTELDRRIHEEKKLFEQYRDKTEKYIKPQKTSDLVLNIKHYCNMFQSIFIFIQPYKQINKMEIIKQELTTLEISNRKQVKLINELMEELAQINQKMSYINGTETLINNEQIWMRLTKNHFHQITSFLNIQETLRLRLVSNTFNRQIIATFSSQKNKYSTILELKRGELQNDVVQPTQEELNLLIEAQNGMQQLSKNMINEMKSFTNPPKIVESVMGAILLLLTGTLPKDSWKASKILLGSADFILKILHFDKENVSEKVYQKVQRELEDITYQRCHVVSQACAELFSWIQAILIYSQFPSVKAKGNKKKLETQIKQIEGSIKIFDKYI